ncbi:restriction endonuclease subunit S [Planococcus maritimus]|uniref:restriction endonuclease subunit S n=1 Tax=Planococcus maritimus TaxID=192421 RepID=UPI00313A1B2D
MIKQMKDSGINWIGEIPSDWKTTVVKKIFRVVPGGTPTTSNESYWENGDIQWATPKDFNRLDSDVLHETERKITQIGLENSSAQIIPENSIILTTRAPVGNVVKNYVEMATNQGCKSLVDKIGLTDSNYYYYVMKITKDTLESLSTGTTFLELSGESLKNFEIMCPPVREQEKIANFLDSKVSQIDSILADTKLSIAEFKKYKQSLITETITKGLNHNAPLRNSGYQWIGEIPKDWNAMKLKRLSTKIIDGTHHTPTYVDKGIPFLRVTDITKSNNSFTPIDFTKTAQITLEEHEELIKRCKPEKGDLLVSKNGTIGVPKVVDWDDNFSIFVSLCLIKVNSLIDVNYLAYYFKSSLIYMEIAIGGKTGTITNLHLEKIKEFVIPLSTVEEQKEIVDFLNEKCAHIDSLIEQKQQLLVELETYKKSFIYEYVTGKKEVL